MKTRIRGVRLRIRCRRRSDLVALVALTLLVPVTLGILAWGQERVAASDAWESQAAFAGMREYYLTRSRVDGNETLTACSSGYHMASLWEILEPSNLEYNTDLGYTQGDSGAGPPTGISGWVRTGWDSGTTTGVPGRDNCQLWTNDSLAWGTTARLPADWTGGSEDMHVWAVARSPCDLPPVRVWCVEDYGHPAYLPLVLSEAEGLVLRSQ